MYWVCSILYRHWICFKDQVFSEVGVNLVEILWDFCNTLFKNFNHKKLISWRSLRWKFSWGLMRIFGWDLVKSFATLSQKSCSQFFQDVTKMHHLELSGTTQNLRFDHMNVYIELDFWKYEMFALSFFFWSDWWTASLFWWCLFVLQLTI